MFEPYSIQVRFYETDALGHVNNAVFYNYMETARAEFFHYITEKSHTGRWNFILAANNCNFRAQVRFRDKLWVSVTVKAIGTKSVTLHHTLVDAVTGQVVADGDATVVHFDFETQQSTPIPDSLRRALEQELHEAVSN